MVNLTDPAARCEILKSDLRQRTDWCITRGQTFYKGNEPYYLYDVDTDYLVLSLTYNQIEGRN